MTYTNSSKTYVEKNRRSLLKKHGSFLKVNYISVGSIFFFCSIIFYFVYFVIHIHISMFMSHPFVCVCVCILILSCQDLQMTGFFSADYKDINKNMLKGA